MRQRRKECKNTWGWQSIWHRSLIGGRRASEASVVKSRTNEYRLKDGSLETSQNWRGPHLRNLEWKQLDDPNLVLPSGRTASTWCWVGQEGQEKAARFMILNDTLYKRGFSMPYLKCVDDKEAKYILEEIHKGICRDHAGTRSPISKVIRTGYFWPTLRKDVRGFVKRCDKCQRFRNVQRIPVERLTPIASSWLFAQWGIDIFNPLPQGKR